MRVLLVGLLGLCACGSDFSSREDGIINGALETGQPWVVMVARQAVGSTSVGLCTGSVIGRRTVLTAKHCVFKKPTSTTQTNWDTVPIGDLTVRTGNDFRSATATYDVASLSTTPGPYVTNSGRNGDDIALLTTTVDLPIAPKALSLVAPTATQAVQLFGYGYTMTGTMPSSDLGIKHAGGAAISSVEAKVFVTMGATWSCTGDSGGPIVDATSGALIGVTSIGPTGCNVSTSYATRVDQYVPLIEAALGTSLTMDAGTGGSGGAGGGVSTGGSGGGAVAAGGGSGGSAGGTMEQGGAGGGTGGGSNPMPMTGCVAAPGTLLALAFALRLARRR